MYCTHLSSCDDVRWLNAYMMRSEVCDIGIVTCIRPSDNMSEGGLSAS